MNELIEQLRARLTPPAPKAEPEPPRSKFKPWLDMARSLGADIQVSQRG